MIDIDEVRIIDINEIFPVLKSRDYFASALRVLRRYNCIPTVGYDITITGDIPINSGTSSSSALLLAWINFLVNAFGAEKTTPDFISKIGYISEVLEHGEPGGMMDHYTIGYGNIVHINTSTPFSCNIIGTELSGLILGVSGVPKETIGLIGELKENALKAIGLVKQNFKNFVLSEVEIKDLNKYNRILPIELIPYFDAAIKNHHYTNEALKEFKNQEVNLKKIGDLMNGHHAVLRDLLKITVPKIDAMIDAALNAGAFGAKIVGSGGGGTIVAIGNTRDQTKIIEAIMAVGAKDAFPIIVSKKARVHLNM